MALPANPRQFTFEGQFKASCRQHTSEKIETILRSCLAGVSRVEKASQFHDRRGIDYWVILKSGVRISIDVKVREIDFAAKDGKDDLALESWSVVENRKPGWTWDGSKKTDYILWLWVDTGRWCLLPFQLLRRVTQKNIFGSQGWRKRFPTKVQQTSGGETYHSECVFVPRRLILKAIEDCFGGAPASMIFQNGAERGS